jgi:hypothetical protein
VIISVANDSAGSCTLTVTGGYNQADTTTMVLADVEDWVKFVSIKNGTDFYWRILAEEGTTATRTTVASQTVTDLTATTATVTTLNAPTLAATHGAGVIGTGVAPTTTRRTVNGDIITEIKVDVQGLASVSTANDAIGLAAGGNAYLAQYTTAAFGIIYKIEMICVEVPATGDTEINLVLNSSGTIAADGAAGTAYGIDSGVWAAGMVVVDLVQSLTANHYFYLAQGASTAGTYTSGQFIIRIYGHALLA